MPKGAEAAREYQREQRRAGQPGRRFRNGRRRGGFGIGSEIIRGVHLRAHAERCRGESQISVRCPKVREPPESFQLATRVGQKNWTGRCGFAPRFVRFGPSRFDPRHGGRLRDRVSSLSHAFNRCIQRHRSNGIDRHIIWRSRHANRVGTFIAAGVCEKKRSSQSGDGETQDRGQGKPRDGKPSGAITFGSGGHIELFPTNRRLGTDDSGSFKKHELFLRSAVFRAAKTEG